MVVIDIDWDALTKLFNQNPEACHQKIKEIHRLQVIEVILEAKRINPNITKDQILRKYPADFNDYFLYQTEYDQLLNIKIID